MTYRLNMSWAFILCLSFSFGMFAQKHSHLNQPSICFKPLLTTPPLLYVYPPDARTSVQSALTGRSVPTSVTARMEPSATTSTGPACATRASRAPAARTASVPRASMDSSATNTAPARLQTLSGTELLVKEAGKLLCFYNVCFQTKKEYRNCLFKCP